MKALLRRVLADASGYKQIRLYEALLRRVLADTSGYKQIRLLDGAIKALLWLYYGSTKALLRCKHLSERTQALLRLY